MDFLNLDRLPESRIYPLGCGELPSGITRDEYIGIFLGCKLKSREKNILQYLAFRYNFKLQRACFVSTRRAANDLDITTNTFIKAKKELVRLGWISVEKGENNNPDQITLLIGKEIEELTWKEPLHKSVQLDKEAKRAGKSKLELTV
jgi:hypothetical protein